ncbi:TM221 protein, partial [Sylvietta virens]|nr:TM221 protein [Sylvietta virens]
ALALSMLLLFQLEAGIASACILTSGILVLLLSVLHALLRASQISQISRISQRSRSEPSQSLYENDSAQPGHGSELRDKTSAAPPPEIHREFSFPPFPEGKSRRGSGSSSDLSSAGSPRSKEFQREFFQREFFQRDAQGSSRTHRTLEEDSGLLREQGRKPWNVMRNAMARKATVGKDSTLV